MSEDLNAKHTLAKRYGSKLQLAQTYHDRLEKWPGVRNEDSERLRDFSDFLGHCETAMSKLSPFNILDDVEELKEILKRLPRNNQNRWAKFVHTWLESLEYLYCQDTNSMSHDNYPPKLCDFIEKETEIACDPLVLGIN